MVSAAIAFLGTMTDSPNENFAQSPIRLAILELFCVCKLSEEFQWSDFSKDKTGNT